MNEYESYDALGLAELIRKGEAKPSEILEAAIARLEERDPKLNAVVIPRINEARKEAAGDLPDGPFRGVPFLLKDLHLLVTGSRTSYGCRLFEDFVADHDSEIVTRYRNAGLVIFGKTASPEFGLTTTTESTLFGQTRNPWNTDHTAGGSSGGAAAAVAAGIVPLANASDGGGSIRIPAATAAAAPPDEPPAVWSVFQGFRVCPKSFDSVVVVRPNSGEAVLPKITSPAFR